MVDRQDLSDHRRGGQTAKVPAADPAVAAAGRLRQEPGATDAQLEPAEGDRMAHRGDRPAHLEAQAVCTASPHDRRELPEPAHESSVPTAPQQEAPGALHHRDVFADRHRGPGGAARRWNAQLKPGGAGPAGRADRAARAGGLEGSANGRPELHDRLVEVPRFGRGRHQPRRGGPQPPVARRRRRAAQEQQTRQDTRHVAVDHRKPLAVGDAQDRPGGVASDARKRERLVEAVREAPAVPGDDDSRRRVQVAGAAVVAESGPRCEDVVQARGRQVRDGRVGVQKALEVGDDRADRGLLQHDLGDPDPVRIARAPPREIAAVAPVPRDETAGEGAGGLRTGGHSGDYNNRMPKDGEPAKKESGAPDPRAMSVARHPRVYRENRYVYPVLSRRARGISIGVNLNPDKVCNFDCIYCQVDRTTPPKVRRVDESRLKEELQRILHEAKSGALFERPEFRALPDGVRVVRDITFAGDGEPPSYPHFKRVVEDVLAIKKAAGFLDLKVILLTNATLIDRPQVKEAMRLMDREHGEFWLKLDAGTEEYYRLVDRTTIPLARVLANILEAARVRPVVLQSLFMRVRGEGPPPGEIDAFCDRVRHILAGGGSISLIQVYTVARVPAEPYVSAIPDDELDGIAARVRRRVPEVPVETFYGGTS